MQMHKVLVTDNNLDFVLIVIISVKTLLGLSKLLSLYLRR